MTGSLWEWRLDEFRARTASGDATPGGGSVAAVGAALGAGLVAMALEVTRRRTEDEDRLAEIDRLLAEAHRLLAALAARADEDVAAFDGFMAALRLPKATDEDKAARRAALAAAAVTATEAPLAAATDAVAALELAVIAAGLAGVNIVSDVAAGVHLLAAGAQAVLLNVDANLPSIKDEAAARSYRDQRDRLAEAADERADEALRIVVERLA